MWVVVGKNAGEEIPAAASCVLLSNYSSNYTVPACLNLSFEKKAAVLVGA